MFAWSVHTHHAHVEEGGMDQSVASLFSDLSREDRR